MAHKKDAEGGWLVVLMVCDGGGVTSSETPVLYMNISESR